VNAAFVCRGKATEVRGKAADLCAMISAAQESINALDFGRVTFHVGKDKAVMNMDVPQLQRKWSADEGAD